MRYRRLQTLGFAALLATLTAIHCLPTEAQADRRRRPWTTYVSASDRLVVECDMRSDTCSDGRRIATTRSTPVPCEVAPGQWEMVPEDTACISYRGLESWAANTSYLSWGAELDRRPPWSLAFGAWIEKVENFWRLGGIQSDSRLGQGVLPDSGTYTLACVMKSPEPSLDYSLRIYQEGGEGGGFCRPPTYEVWTTRSCTREITGTPTTLSVFAYSRSGVVDIAGCWLTRTDTPGRACWGGEAPVTCAADRHTISTEGWPSEAGEVSLVYTPGQVENEARYLISASTFGIEGWEFYVRHTDTMSFLVHNEGSTIYSSDPLTWEPRPYALRVRWGDGIVSFWRDEVLVGTSPMTRLPNGLKSTALIGSRDGSGRVNGSISSLRVRSFE